MKYDFSVVLDRRNSDSEKYNVYPENVLPMWIADSDFETPKEITQAINKRLEHICLGYGVESEKLKSLIKTRMEKLYNWQIDTDWIVFLPGVVPGLNISRSIAGDDGDEVLSASINYPHLLNKSHIVKRESKYFHMLNVNGRYTPDFAGLDKIVSDKSKLLLLGNPHNPVGTVYNDQELQSFANFALKHNLLICSDEIHADLILDSNCKHRPIATISKEVENITITIMAASKTFNIAGMNCAYAIISNENIRNKFKAQTKGLVGGVNVLGFVASEAAYEYGADWLAEQLIYLRNNADYLYRQINAIPDLSMNRVESTFLAWVDISEILPKIQAKGFTSAQKFFVQHGVAFSDGADFGDANFIRINFACPHSTLEKAVARIKTALATL